MINLNLDVRETELVLIHLGKGEYSMVAQLVEKIKNQATAQINAIQAEAAKRAEQPKEEAPAEWQQVDHPCISQNTQKT